MAARATTFYALLLTSLQLLLTCHVTFAAGGIWDLLLSNVGISAMHMQLLPNDRVVMFDRTNFGPSNISLPTVTAVTIHKTPSPRSTALLIPSNTMLHQTPSVH
ncbi:hypothetical protein Bca52824_014426 [Brassica carinata]|uniref:Uncharacterized protein n=1 Tax=Brassica carinata TaxID=52824 RepID=A0A8X7VZV0_BRACI|nr:hypothetical protein Bca52824_014426 [Brassica carinata]